MYGVGIGIVLAIVYWTDAQRLRALGRRADHVAAVLAAWAPNILFGAAAVYMLLTVRDLSTVSNLILLKRPARGRSRRVPTHPASCWSVSTTNSTCVDARSSGRSGRRLVARARLSGRRTNDVLLAWLNGVERRPNAASARRASAHDPRVPQLKLDRDAHRVLGACRERQPIGTARDAARRSTAECRRPDRLAAPRPARSESAARAAARDRAPGRPRRATSGRVPTRQPPAVGRRRAARGLAPAERGAREADLRRAARRSGC